MQQIFGRVSRIFYPQSIDTVHVRAHRSTGCAATKAWREHRGCLAPPVCCLEERGSFGHGDGLTRQSIICHLTAYARHTKGAKDKACKTQKNGVTTGPFQYYGKAYAFFVYKKCIQLEPK